MSLILLGLNDQQTTRRSSLLKTAIVSLFDFLNSLKLFGKKLNNFNVKFIEEYLGVF